LDGYYGKSSLISLDL